MPRLNEEQRVRIDRARLMRGIDRRTEFAKDYNRNVRYYVGNQQVETLIGANDIPIVVNKIFSAVRSQVPALMFSNPYFNVASDNSRSVGVERKQKEQILNFIWRRAHGEWAVRQSILAAQFAFGAIKIGYQPFFKSNPKAGVVEFDDSGAPIIDKTLESGLMLPKLTSGELFKDENSNYVFDQNGVAIPEPGELLDDEDWFVDWVPWDRIIFDPEGGNDFRKHAWVAEEWVRPTQELRDDPMFQTPSGFIANETVRRPEPERPLGVDTDSWMSSSEAAADDESVAADEGRTRGYTIYDFRHHEIRWLAKSGTAGDDVYLREAPMPVEQWDRGPYHGGPFVFLWMNDVPGRWEGVPDLDAMIPIQDEINLQRSKIATHTRRADRHYVAEKGLFESEEEWDKLTKGGDMSVAEVTNVQGLLPVQVAPMDPTLQVAVSVVANDFDEVAGAGEMRGVATSDTATQGAILENRQQIRESDRRDNRIKDFLVTAGSKMLRSVQANMTLPQYVQIADPKYARPYAFFGTVDPADIDGDFLVSIDVGQMRPRTNPVYRNQVLAFMQQVFVPLASNPVGMRFLVPELLEEMFQIYELGNTEIAGKILEVVEQTTQALDAQEQGGTPNSPNGAVGVMTRDIGGGNSGGAGMPLGSQRVQ